MGVGRAARHGDDGVSRRGPRWPVLITFVLVPLLVLGSVALGVRQPLSPFLSGGRQPESLDYSRGPVTQYGQLRDSFVESIVGRLAAPSVASLVSVADRARTFERPSLVVGRGPVSVTHRLTNDAVSRAYAVPALPFTAHTDSTRATREGGDPASCSPVGGTIWYRFTAPAGIGLAANTFGTGRATALGVFAGTPSHLTAVACDTDAEGNAALAFAASAATTYYFQISAPVGGGPTTFALGLQGRTSRLAPPSTPLAVAGVGGVSSDGRYVAFSALENADSFSSRACLGFVVFVPVAPPALCQLRSYVLERRTGKIELVSIASSGEPANDFSLAAGISDDGRYITLISTATNMDPSDTNTCGNWQIPGSCPDIYVRDRIAKKTVRISVSTSGKQVNAVSWIGQISGDGRFVMFGNDGSGLADKPTGCRQTYMRDRDADGNGVFDERGPGRNRTFLVSVADDGTPGNCATSRALPFDTPGSESYAMSRNGRYAIFRSSSSNLVPHDHNRAFDVFVRDVIAHKTTRVSVSSRGEEANADTNYPFGVGRNVSDDGRIAVFGSMATNLVPHDTNGAEDVFVRDMVRGTTERVSVASDGTQAEGESRVAGEVIMDGSNIVALAYFGVSQSPLQFFTTTDGRSTFFSSGATNLVPGDTNGVRDIFRRDLIHHTTTRVSVSTAGNQANGGSVVPTASGDGRVLTFESEATNLIDGQPETVPSVLDEAFVRELP